MKVQWFDHDNHSIINHSGDESYPMFHTDSEADDHDRDMDRGQLSVTERPGSAPQSLSIQDWVCDGCERKV